jgi:pullulanase/glycogen debranching enzyme
MHLHGIDGGEIDHIYFIAHAHWEEKTFALPHLQDRHWRCVVDTTQAPPHDIAEPCTKERLVNQNHYTAGPRSVVVLIGK